MSADDLERPSKQQKLEATETDDADDAAKRAENKGVQTHAQDNRTEATGPRPDAGAVGAGAFSTVTAKQEAENLGGEAAAAAAGQSCVLQLSNMVTAAELDDDEEYADIVADVSEECAEVGGTVAKVVIPRSGAAGCGLVYVRFEQPAAAERARVALDGRTFGANIVGATLYPEQNFAAGDFVDISISSVQDPDPVKQRRFLGRVHFFDSRKGFGFLTPAAVGLRVVENVFFHIRYVVLHNQTFVLPSGREVSFRVEEQSDGRPHAVDIRHPDGTSPVDQPEREAGWYEDRLKIAASSFSMVGRKESNEDRYFNSTTGSNNYQQNPSAQSLLNQVPPRFGKWFGVYDGHGGEECSDYLVKELHKSTVAVWSGQQTAAAISAAFTEGFLQTDNRFLEVAKQRGGLRDGSTACVVLVTGSEPSEAKLLCANVGDCRAVLCRGGRAVRLSEDHKPNRRDEEARLKKAGGFVLNIGGIWRVTNQLGGLRTYELEGPDSESRGLYLAIRCALLSYCQVPHASKFEYPLAWKEIKIFDVEADDLFVVIACDGVWDVLSDQEVVDIAAPHFDSPHDAAAAVAKSAFRKGSLDNITATFVQFSWHSSERAKTVISDRKKRMKAEMDAEEDFDMFA